MQEASYLWEEQEKCDQGVNQRLAIFVIFFSFELSGGYTVFVSAYFLYVYNIS